MASVSCASWLIEPYDIAPDLKRVMIVSTGSTSSIGTGVSGNLMSKSPRSVQSRFDWSLTSWLYCWKTLKSPVRTAYWSLCTVSGLKRWYSPSLRYWYWPPASSVVPLNLRAGKPRSCRVATSAAMVSRPMPETRDAVQVKYLSMTSRFRPIASKIWAPQ